MTNVQEMTATSSVPSALMDSGFTATEIAVQQCIDQLSDFVLENVPPDGKSLDDSNFEHSVLPCLRAYVQHRLRGHPHEKQLAIQIESKFSDFINQRDSKSLVELQSVFWWARKFLSTPVADLSKEYSLSCEAQQRAWRRSQGSSAWYIRGKTAFSSRRRRDPAHSMYLPCLWANGRIGVQPYNYRVVPPLPQDVVDAILSCVQREPQLSFLFPDGRILRLRLSNPMVLPYQIADSYRCGTCANYPSRVAFQSSTGTCAGGHSPDEGGVTLCFACAVYFVHEHFLKLQAALSPPEYRPLASNKACNMVVWSAAYEGNSVRLSVSLEPRNLYLCVWQVQEDSTRSDSFSAALHSVAKAAETWRERGTIVSLRSGKSAYDPVATCPICLETLDSLDGTGGGGMSRPVMKTTCQHWFHVHCIEGVRRSSGHGNACPLCRSRSYMPALYTNETFAVTLTLKNCSRSTRPPLVRVAVAALLDEKYVNPTSVVACQVVSLNYGEEFSKSEQTSSCTPM
ncbi:hypothetical protein TRVL_00089 [Trypanosoma vivax]|uniref:RING-type domain-containing protein n=1 Tax=Trypanosoma vivax (strain Y486) TaxID=1055687 RepID=G0TTM5_TRYVY|nr:hypothetical protein TRVL_00089 [Trypanosoma vivax]CCC47306.1 conserved hypothetical protein [Trypanosoma vivax Y486]